MTDAIYHSISQNGLITNCMRNKPFLLGLICTDLIMSIFLFAVSGENHIKEFVLLVFNL